MEQETSLRDDIANAMAEVKPDTVEVVDVPEAEITETPVKERDEAGKFKAKETDPATEVKIEPAPQSLSGAIKAKWAELPEDVRQEWTKREGDFHQAMTRHDGDLNLGRQMKDVITPYMAQIQAEGGTPAGAVKDLLNTAYLLRTGSAQQKAQMVHQIIQTYGIDIGQAQPQEAVDPTIQNLQQQIAELKQLANPATIKKQLQEEHEAATINEEVQAFASDPANVHY